MELKLYNTTSSKLNSLNIVGGQLIVSKDDSCLYVDIDSIGRLKITDWIELETDNDRLAVLAPISGKIYYVSETNAIWKYVKSSWKCLNEVNKEEIFEYVLENLQSYLDAKVPTSRKINGKALTSDIVLSAADVGALTESDIATVKTEVNNYTDKQIANLLNNSSEAVDSIYELRDAMEENADAIESLVSISGSKANASDLTSHLNNQSNPHNVTKEQLGLYVSTWSGTRAEYDVLTTKQDDCLYIITDESETTEFESISNKVTVINASSDDKHYPSAKAVYQVMQTIDGYEKTSNKDTVISIGSDDNHYPTSKAVYDNVNNTVNSAKETILQTLEKRVYGVEKQSNKVTEITEDAKHTTYPSSLAVLHAIETFGGTDIETTNTIDENSTADEVPNAKATYDFVKSEMNNINEIIQSQTSTVYSGTSEPDGSVGKVGDLWVVIE